VGGNPPFCFPHRENPTLRIADFDVYFGDQNTRLVSCFAMQAAHALSLRCVHRIARKRIHNVIVVTLLAAGLMAAQSQAPGAAKPQSRLVAAVDRTLEQGHDAILPSHVSHLLGISPDEHEVPVKQFVEMGEPIRGFEVSTAEHNNVVIFVESRARKESTFYLTSRRGVLRKVLSVVEGVGYDRPPKKADKDEFEKEKQYWQDRLGSKQQ
jgi:hypothetical protein